MITRGVIKRKRMNLPVVNHFLRWLEAPFFAGDEEKTHQAQLLNAIALAVIFFMVLLLPVIGWSRDIPTLTKVIDGLMLLAGLWLRRRLFQGRVKSSGLWFMVLGFILITASIISLGSVFTPTTSTYLFMVVSSGILFGVWGITLSTIASSLLVGGYVLAQQAGIFPEQTYETQLIIWVLYVLLFGLTGWLSYFSHRILAKALERSRKEITERAQTEARLRESEARYRNLFEQTHDAVLMIDLQGRCLAANQRAAEMFGYPVEQFPGLPVSQIAPDREQNRQALETLLSGESLPHLESQFRRKDGTLFPVEAYLDLVRDIQGQPQQLQCVARDISERKQTEDALKAANEQLNHRVAEVERLHKELREQAIRDPLTGLYNRRYLSETLPRELQRVMREQKSLSILIADLDLFKKINDAHGHQAGDRMLVEVARAIKSLTRGSDIVCRYGGEEFIIVMPGINVEQATARAEQIRAQIENQTVECHGRLLRVTISLGVAAYPDHGMEAEEISIKADQALYRSKQTGRNRVTVWSEAREPLP